MNADEMIRQAFADAEAATPDVEMRFRVIREAIEPMRDDDQRQFEFMLRSISGENRAKLALDYETWIALNGLARELLAKAQLEMMNSPGLEPGPLLARMTKPVMRPPRKWRLCYQCGGKGDDQWIAKCNGCGGAGYNV